MYEVQKELYVYLDSLEDLKHYAEKKKRIDAEIERAEEEHAREAALYAQKKKCGKSVCPLIRKTFRKGRWSSPVS